MTAASADIQWFIARDGKQYGPVSDSEMRKLVELRHLKPGDLLWRPGFPEWRPAHVVFPPAPQPMQPKLSTQPPAQQPHVQQPAPQPQPQVQPERPLHAEPSRIDPRMDPRVEQRTEHQRPEAAPRPTEPTPSHAAPSHAPLSHATPMHGATAPAQHGQGAAPAHSGFSPAQSSPAQSSPPQSGPAQWPDPAGARMDQQSPGWNPNSPYDSRQQQPVTQPGARSASAGAGGPAPSGPTGPQPAPGQAMPTSGQFQPNRPAFEPRRPTMQPAPAQAPVLAPPPGSPQMPHAQAQAGPRGPQGGPSIAGGPSPTAADPIAAARSRAIATMPHAPEEEAPPPPKSRGRSKTLAAAVAVLLIAAGAGYYLATGGAGGIKSIMTAVTKPAADGKVAPLDNLGDTSEALDAHFQRTPMWVVVKKEFPEWYGERLKETAKLSADKTPEDKIAKHLVEKLVGLRRQFADHALAASTPRLKLVASAFLGNLKALSAKSTEACYSFISQGETSPAVIEMMRSSEQNAAIQAQVAAIFEAIAEGRKSPTQHSAPIKTDYDSLADQLTKLGWSQTDLQLFADSRALAKAPPEKVCKMVQDWFTAHIAIGDAEVQERLLVETLRPVVAG